MKTISYSRNRFPPDVSGIRSGSTSGSPPSYRDVEDALVERGLTPAMSRSVGTLKFRPMIARNFHEIRPKAFSRSRLDEVDGKSKCGAPSGSKAGFVRSWSKPKRDKAAVLRLRRKLLRRQPFVPAIVVTDN
jgi:transposase-like protein